MNAKVVVFCLLIIVLFSGLCWAEVPWQEGAKEQEIIQATYPVAEIVPIRGVRSLYLVKIGYEIYLISMLNYQIAGKARIFVCD